MVSVTVGQMNDTVWKAVAGACDWLDAANGTDDQELTCRILKITEESGEAAAAWIGVLGTNPRKGVTHTRDEVAAELGDVVFSALVALRSLGFDPQAVLDECAGKVTDRFAA